MHFIVIVGRLARVVPVCVRLQPTKRGCLRRRLQKFVSSMAATLVDCSTSRGYRQTYRRRSLPPAPPPPLKSLNPHALQLREFALFCARGMGVVCEGGRWRYDTSHSPPRGRLPLSFGSRVVRPPDALYHLCDHGPLVRLDRSQWRRQIDAPVLQLDSLSPLATPVLAFYTSGGDEHIRPDTLCDADSATAAHIYWWLVSTDSCEAVHAGVLLALRRLSALHSSEVGVCDERGCPLVAWGMQTAERVKPFDRIVKVASESVRMGSSSSGGAVRMECSPTPPASHGGAMHQLIWLRAADGRETVFDFTGCQYGITESLEATQTPFWSCPIEKIDTYGFRLVGEPASFLPSEPLPSVFSTDVRDFVEGSRGGGMHLMLACWMRDSILGVMAKAFDRPGLVVGS